jgi:D-3-phosphoglycerate dehydrogenase
VAGAALDVFTSEPPKEHLRALIDHPNLVCTPHLGASTDEAQVNVARDIAAQMCDVFDAKDYVGIVNVSYIAASSLPHIKPFKILAETIGSIQSQLSESPVKKMTLKTWGGRDVNITTKTVKNLLEAVVSNPSLSLSLSYFPHSLMIRRYPNITALITVVADIAIITHLYNFRC